MKNKFFIFIALVFLIFSCQGIPTVIDVTTHIIIKNGQNENLLDSTITGSFKEEDIRIYYLKNGIREEVYDANLTWPRNFDIFKVDGTDEYVMVFAPNLGKKNDEITTTIIKWNDQDEDIIKTEMIMFETDVNVTSISKIWFNDDLVYDDKVNGPSTLGNGFVQRLIRINKQ